MIESTRQIVATDADNSGSALKFTELDTETRQDDEHGRVVEVSGDDGTWLTLTQLGELAVELGKLRDEIEAKS